MNIADIIRTSIRAGCNSPFIRVNGRRIKVNRAKVSELSWSMRSGYNGTFYTSSVARKTETFEVWSNVMPTYTLAYSTASSVTTGIMKDVNNYLTVNKNSNTIFMLDRSLASVEEFLAIYGDSYVYFIPRTGEGSIDITLPRIVYNPFYRYGGVIRCIEN